MPRTGTANEPADVKRAAAAEGVGRKDAGEPLEMAPTAGPEKLSKLPFFEMLSAMTERDWEDRLVYLYRVDKNIIKANEKDNNYIERISHAFDEEYVKTKHGGGQFMAILKNTRVRNGAERRYIFKIEGSPIIHDDEVNIAKKNGAAGEKSETAMLIEQMERMVQRVMDISSKSNGTEQEAMTRVVGMLSEATKGALQIQQEGLKSQVGSSTGHPLVDKFLEASISKLGNEPKQDSLDQLTKVLALMRELNKGNDRPAPAGLLGNLGEIKGVLDVLKELGVKIGGGDAAVEGGMDWRSVLASTLPQGIQVIGGYIDRWMQQNAERNRILAGQMEAQRRAAGLPPQLPAPAPVPAPPAPAPVQTSAPAPASALPQNFAAAPSPQTNPSSNVVELPSRDAAEEQPAADQPQLQVDLDFVCLIIRRCFDAGDSGGAPAIMLKRIYEAGQLEPLRPYFGDATQLRNIAGLSPIIAEIMNDPAFPEFLEDFVEEMNLKEEEEPGPEPEGAPPA